MAYLAPIHRPSSVRHALKLKFLDRDEECLVVAKANRLEVYVQTAEGLILRHTRTVYGKITMLQKLRPASASTDHLFVGTDRYTYFTVSWDARAQQIRTEKSYVDQADKTGRDSEMADRCLVDPSGRYMVLELFEGILTVIPIGHKGKKKAGDLEPGALGDPVPSRISELFVRSSTFLYPRNPNAARDKPKLALLYVDNQEKLRLSVRCLEYSAGGAGEVGSAEFHPLAGLNEELDLGATHLIPVPPPVYGLLVLAETSITYYDETNQQTLVEPLERATIFVAWEQIDAQRWIISDDCGNLYLLMLIISHEDEVSGWKLDMLGIISTASTLIYLDGGLVFVGSHQGDSQVIKIQERAIEVVQTISNIAPILDFTVMDMGSRAGEGQTNEYSSGQARLVTGSGAFQDGSLRSVRSGVGLEELGNLGGMSHTTDIFALRSHSSIETADILVLSFVDETRVFHFSDDGEVEELEEYNGLALENGTILASNITNGRLLQVTNSAVYMVDLENGMMVANWSTGADHKVTAASANDHFLALSIDGIEAVILSLSEELRLTAKKSFAADTQIACIHLPNVLSGICIIGFWQSAAVTILEVESLTVIENIIVSDDAAAVPRSLLLTQILPKQSPTLFVAMADGNVITFSVDSNAFTLSAKKSIVLGTQQADFKALPQGDGLFNVFATCEHPSLIYGSEDRIVYSAVTAEKATCVCPFNTIAYPGAIAIATAEDVQIAMVDTERTTHVQTLPVHETVRRVAYSTKLKVFGLGTIKRTLMEGVEVVQSHFKLADEVVFKELDTFSLNEDELVESVIRADLHERPRKTAERFVVGTAYLSDEHTDSVRGRIIVFEVTQDRTLKVVTELAVKGACRALGMVDGNVVAALVKTVVVYAFDYGSLNKVASYRTATAPIDITVTGNLIAIADIMKSVSIVEYTHGISGEPDRLTEVARHFQTAWSTAVANVDDDTFLEADAEGNLMVLHRNINGITVDDRRRLEVTSEMRLGEMVNRIRRINVPTSAEATVIPRAFMATVDGSIYLFALIRQEKQDLLMRLQTNVAEFVQSPGNMPFNKYRAFKNAVRETDEPYRFVDGELIEKFLELPSSLQDKAIRGLGVDVEEVKSMIEGLRRLH